MVFYLHQIANGIFESDDGPLMEEPPLWDATQVSGLWLYVLVSNVLYPTVFKRCDVFVNGNSRCRRLTSNAAHTMTHHPSKGKKLPTDKIIGRLQT